MRAIDRKSKICKKCKKEKDTGEFYEQVQREGEKEWKYYDTLCKPCRTIYSTIRRQKIKLEAIKILGGKCMRCGIADECPAIYDFHHRDPTKKDFAIGRNTKSLESIKEELMKCDLFCSNCHRKHHYGLTILTGV